MQLLEVLLPSSIVKIETNGWNFPFRQIVYKDAALVCGDFNINLLHVDNNPTASAFIDLMYSNTFFPTIHWSTRVTPKTATLIDNIFCNSPSAIHSGVILSDISDHFPIFTVLNVKFIKNNISINSKPSALEILMKRSFSSNNINKFSELSKPAKD